MMPTISITALSDEQLIAEVKQLAAVERKATAALVRCLMEIDARRLYLGEGCSSLFTYCTRVLHLSESAAYNRIEAARVAGRFAPIIDALEGGFLTLTAVRLLAPHLRVDNYEAVLAAARHKSKADIERLVASLSPKPPVPSTIRKLPEPRPAAARTDSVSIPIAMASHRSVLEEEAGPVPPPSPPARRQPPALVTPLAPERYHVQFTVSLETHDKLRRAQDLLRHVIPTGDPAEIFDRALTLLLQEAERRRCAATTSPRAERHASDGSRHVPAAVKREVWRRDEGRCAYVGTDGRCMERGFLEYHHVQPYAVGGAATVANIELRCRSHNVHEATLFFSASADGFVRERQAQY